MNQELGITHTAGGGGYGPPPGGYGPPGGPPGGYGPPGGPPGAPGGYQPPGYPPGAPGGYGPPGGAPMAPPGGGPMMGGGPGADPALEKEVSKWFTLSIVSIFCGCGLPGLINVYMAHLAKQALAQGDLNTAREKIKVARMLCIVGFVLVGIYVVLVGIYIVLLLTGAVASSF